MNSSPAQIAHTLDVDAIVREVVRRLREQGVTEKPDPPVSLSDAAVAPAMPAADAVRLDRRLITLADLPANLEQAKRLEVPRGTVVTPAARDALKQMGVCLARISQRRSQAETPDRYLLLDGALQNRGWVAAIAAAEGRAYRRHQATLPGCIDHARLVLGTNPASQVLLLTTRPGLAAAAMNRVPAARAAVLPRLDLLQGVLDDLAPNVLVLDAATWPAFQLALLAGRWRTPAPDPLILSLLKERSSCASPK